MLTALILILILSVLVLIHEFGHFYTARKMGVRVEEFGWGLPPRIWGKKIGETIYSINWLPFGGFVKLTGEAFEDDSDVTSLKKERSDKRNFKSKSPLQRAAILVAGVVMNFFLAVVVYYLFFFLTNFKTLTLPMFFDYDFAFGNVESLGTVVTAFGEDSAAETAGILQGEAILSINNTSVSTASDVREVLSQTKDTEVEVKLMDVKGSARNERLLSITPKMNEAGDYLLGVMLSDAFRLDYSDSKWLSGLQHTWNMLSYSVHTLGGLIGLSVEKGDIAPVSESVSGPVGISRAISSILDYKGKDVLIGLLDLTALLSISLAFINLMPFPALDGGRLVFVLFELIVGKKVSDRVEGTIHQWGMLLLLGLLAVVTVKDVISLF